MNYEFEIGDLVVYNPTLTPLPPLRDRLEDVGVVRGIDDHYVHIYFHSISYFAKILKWGVTHYPLSPKSIRLNMCAVLTDVVAAVEARMAALLFSERTGITGNRGFGPADILRAFLEPAERRRKHIYIQD